jgi:hypothetical protein
LLEVTTDGGRPPVDALTRVPGVADVQLFGDRVHVRLAGISQAQGADAVREALRGRGRSEPDVRPIPASLEDVFIELIGRGQGE